MRISGLRESAAAGGGRGGSGAEVLRPAGSGDRGAAHGADRVPAAPDAGPAGWRGGRAGGTGPPGVRVLAGGVLARSAASGPRLRPGRRARRHCRPMRGWPGRWRRRRPRSRRPWPRGRPRRHGLPRPGGKRRSGWPRRSRSGTRRWAGAESGGPGPSPGPRCRAGCGPGAGSGRVGPRGADRARQDADRQVAQVRGAPRGTKPGCARRWKPGSRRQRRPATGFRPAPSTPRLMPGRRARRAGGRCAAGRGAGGEGGREQEAVAARARVAQAERAARSGWPRRGRSGTLWWSARSPRSARLSPGRGRLPSQPARSWTRAPQDADRQVAQVREDAARDQAGLRAALEAPDRGGSGGPRRFRPEPSTPRLSCSVPAQPRPGGRAGHPRTTQRRDAPPPALWGKVSGGQPPSDLRCREHAHVVFAEVRGIFGVPLHEPPGAAVVPWPGPWRTPLH